MAFGANQYYGGTGYVNVYRLNESSLQFIKIGATLKGGKDGDWFGASVSFSSDSSLLAIRASQTGKDPGYVRVYRYDASTASFSQLVTTLVGRNDGDQFGMSLSFSPGSNLLAVGADQGGYRESIVGNGLWAPQPCSPTSSGVVHQELAA